MARTWGVPDFRFLAMPHPIANLKDAELDQRAAAIVPEVVKLLLEGQTSRGIRKTAMEAWEKA